MKTGSFKTYTGPGRVVIARYAPRQTPGGYKMFKELAPGPWFNSVSKADYDKRFHEEVLGRLDPQETWDRLHKLVGKDANGQQIEPVLMCWEKPPFTEQNWCHRRVQVAPWFEKHLGVVVPEWTAEVKTRVQETLSLGLELDLKPVDDRMRELDERIGLVVDHAGHHPMDVVKFGDDELPESRAATAGLVRFREREPKVPLDPPSNVQANPFKPKHACEACGGNVAGGKKCWACGLQGPAGEGLTRR